MATAVATLTRNGFPNGRDETQRREINYGTCALSAGGTYATNGIPLTWSQLPEVLTTQTQPQTVRFFTTASGLYDYWFDAVHNTLRIKLAGVELTNGAAITTDSIGFKAEWVRGI